MAHLLVGSHLSLSMSLHIKDDDCPSLQISIILLYQTLTSAFIIVLTHQNLSWIWVMIRVNMDYPLHMNSLVIKDSPS